MAPSASLYIRALAFTACIAVAQAASAETTTSEGQHLFAGYVPILWAAVLGLVLYGAIALYQWFLWFRNGRHKYMLTLTIGMTCMTVGFVLRLAYRNSPYSLGLYAIQLLFLLLSPCAFLATDYVLLKHLAQAMGPEVVKSCLFLPISLVVKLFVWSDVVTFLMQAAGGGLSATDGKGAEIGPKIALIGLVIQLVSFALFTLLLIVFALRVRSRFPHLDSSSPGFSFAAFNPFSTRLVVDWRILFYVMLLTCVGIMVRCVFRAIEYAQGYSGYLVTHEVYFYLLDALPLFLSMFLYAWLWPTRVIDGAAQDSSASLAQGRLAAGVSGASSKRYETGGSEAIGLRLYRE
ncbi:hypothetical protein JCM10213_002201 [Rhodosporidiobolus nylandii]